MPDGSISSKVIGGFTKASASNTKARDGDHNRLKLEQRAQTFLRSMHTVPDQAPSIPKSYRDFPDSEVEDASLDRTSFRISEMDTEMSSVDDIGSESGAHSKDESFALDEEEEPMPRYIIHPQSTNKVVWDVFVSVLIFYSVINIPFRIGFGVDSEGFAYGFDWFVDGMFGFDIILSFFTAYWHNDELETSRRRIVVHYLRGWFLIDLASTLPFDHIVAALMHNDNASDVNSSLRSIKLIKFFRLVRLIKLVRLLKLKKFGSSLEGAFSLNPALQRLLKLLLQIIFICHLLACFWYFTSTLDDSSDDNWVMAHGLSSDSIPTQYLASFYWTVATMMAVGYGDIHAVNDMERMYSIFVQVVGATCFGFIIANISAFLETFDPRASAYRSRMDRLKQYMRDRDLPRKLQRRVRKYYDYVLSKESIFDDANILAQLPSHLTETVILHIHGHKARTINFLKYEDSSFVAYIMARSKVLLALSGEVICEQDSVGTDIYMVLKGKVEAIVLEIDETEHKRFRINQDEEENALMRKGAERINSASGTLQINAPALASDADAGREAPPMLTGSTGNSSSRLEPPRPRDVRNMVKQQLGASSRNVVKKGIAFGKKVKHAVVTGLYNRGSNFGEVGVLRNKPHEVTFRANQTCDLLSISKEHMEYAIYMYPTSALRFRKRCDKHAELLEKSIASSTEYFPHSDRHVKTLVTVDARMHQSAATVERRIGRMVLSNMIAYDITGRFQISTAGVHKLSDIPARSNTGLMVSRVAGKICEDVEMDLDSVLRELWIVPPGHGLKVKWDLLIAFFIVYSVLLVPFRIGFAQSSEGFSKAFDILVDIFFGLDMIVAFRTGFESSDQDVVIVVPLAIAKQYLKGWFLVDFMSTFPFDAVLAALLASADEEALRSFKLIKIFRMIRLLKLIRLFKLRKILGELDSEIELSSGFTKLVTLFLQITFVAHLFACFWFFAASSEDDIRERWYVRLGFSPDDDQDVSSKYISSLYWSFTTMTTVGYGDISPTSDPERIYAIFIMIMGATIFGYVVGSIANLISQLDIADALYKAKMNELDEYLSEQGIPRDLRRECKSCYAYSLSLKSVFDERALLSALSPSLRQEIIITIHQAAVDAIPLFRDQTATFTADLIQVMHPQLALPGTFIVRHNSIGGMIYFIVNGEVLVYEDTWPQPDEQGRVDFERAKLFRHRNGNFFGHQAVLSGKRHEITAKCTKLTQLYILSKSAIGELVDSVPPFALLLQSALRSAIRRQDMAFGKLQRGRAGNKTSKLWSLVQNHFNDILNMSPNKFKRMSVEANSCTKLEELIGRIVGVNLDTRVGEPGGADSFTATVRKIREAKRNGGFDVSSSSSIADLPSAEVSAEMQALPVTGAWKFKASQVEKKVDKRASDGSVSDTSLWEASEPGVVTPAESTSVLFDTAADPDNDASDARPMHDE
ncbi:Potassium voltage-gated channel subfamily H member 6 [Hondaea fermentalgiana]|uniref:Potassium voltage-gated channel subfamily H member 6 n=1 Tax=Hondaea fermentalgiana TaxID=2315210 RepID=A0A2R5GCA9_9STRA|nr:Potassium voltage-gated channel subfamily H member 6 [Hondaea fermentalgiana]|eukprot:GBG25384.1 Potassium voltage-gated channel subfamily H member 6 [Hondaea fermentalgiana]